MLLDAHAHLDKYGPAIDPVLAELRRRRVFTVAVSVDPASYAATCAIAEREPLVLPAFGIHPACAAEWSGRLEQIDDLLAATPVIGEIGLDYHFVEDRTTYPAQRRVFDHCLAAAAAGDQVVNLHTKAAEDDVLAALRRHGIRRAIVHWYSGPVRAFRGLVEHGCWFTVGVEVLQSDVIRAIAAEIPAERLLTETDNPGGWEWLTGETGRPGLVLDVQRELAEVRGVPVAELQAQVAANWRALMDGDVRLTAPYERAAASFVS